MTIIAVILSLSFLFFVSELPALSASANTTNQSVNYILPILKAVSTFFNPLCVLGAGFGIIQIVVSRDSRTVQGALKFIKMVIIAFCIFNCLGAIVAYTDGLGIKNFYTFKSENLSNIVNSYKS